MQLSVQIGKLELKNPVIAASGTFGYGEEFAESFYEIAKLGAVVTKGISLEPRAGNEMPRVIETAAGMINAIGLANVGLHAFVSEKLPFLVKQRAVVIANILGSTVEEYAKVAEGLAPHEGVAAIELNISCPNVSCGGIAFGIDPKAAAGVTGAVRKAFPRTLIVKLSPQAASIPEMARAVESAGADAISLINTIPAMAIDAKARRPVLANVTGGLSGPAVKPIALRMVHEAACAVKIPVVGIGGIMTAEDAIEFMLAGATAVQVGTANFVAPMAAVEIVGGIEKWCRDEKVARVSDLVGALELP
ncbi:MAG: dihydroorotate dehydrogenase [Proteobacteria bacterium]|nr:dihydroorotate dehydrogenase [Pseudomonadota bacterium]